MSFSFEQKVNGKFLFLDVEVSQHQGKFVTKFHEELNFLKYVFLKNGYPFSLLTNVLKWRLISWS